MQSAVQPEMLALRESDTTGAPGRCSGDILDYGAGTIADRIAEWSSTTPGAPAIECGPTTLSYHALQRRVHRLADWMNHKGVVHSDIVALEMERSPDLVIAMLAVWRVGAAFLPLDPAWPAKRRQSVMDDARPKLILRYTPDAGLLYQLQSGEEQSLRHEELLDRDQFESFAHRGAASDLAYVLYTSGSTGTPKGVMVEHGNILNYAAAVSEALRLKENKRWGTLGSLAVDLGYTGVFGALFNGACLVLADATEAKDGRAFARFIRERRIDCVKIVPSYLDALLDGDGAALPRKLILGGEATPRSLLERIWKIAPDCKIYNHYGPTETTVGVMVHEVHPRTEIDAVLPLTTVLSNCRVLVLNEQRQPVPVGEVGELYVGGAQVCRGYLGGRNDSAFIVDPYRGGERLYRTGDLAYPLPGGGIRLAGRADHQVKILGYRVEPAEVEAALLEQPGVRQAAVICKAAGNGEPRLVAFLVADSAVASDEGQQRLRDSLATALPAYMRPSAYVLVDELPRLASGKVDRRALSERPMIEAAAAPAKETAPTDGMELAIAQCMAELLKLDTIAADQDFFELGGNSMLVIKLVARLRKRLGLDIPAATVFEHGSPKALAAEILLLSATSEGRDGIPIADRRGPLVLSPAQARQWFLWRLDKESTAYHTGGGLRLRGALDVAALRWAFEQISARHESLRTVFKESETGVAEQVILPPGRFALSELDVQGESRDLVEAKAAQEAERIARTPFDLTRGPLFRVALIRLSGEDHVVLVVMHHIISDGWSTQIIVDEFVELYRSRATGREPSLQALPIQYADYAVWQRDWLQAGERERQLEYWRGRLAGEEQVLQLPTDHPRPTQPTYRAAHYSFELPAELTDGLKMRARERRGTLFMMLLAGFQVLLHRYTGQSDICIGTTHANRSRPETQSVIGFFVNTQVLRLRVDTNMTMNALLDDVREAVIGAQQHQDLPFDQLVEALQPERYGSHQPLFQVLMDHQQADFRQLGQLPGLELLPYELSEQGALFELWMNSVEQADGRVNVRLSYARELFEPETVARLGRHYLSVLQEIVNRPQRCLRDIGLLGEDELLMLRGWGADARRYPSGETLHRVIEQQAVDHPTSTAVSCDDARLSYAELNRRANQLAHRLIRLGVKPESKVGLAAHRSPELIIGLLAILKAGGAYVPLDPSYPGDRLSYMMRDSGIEFLITQAAALEQLPVVAGVTSVSIDTLDLSAEPADDPRIAVHPDGLAYVIYTSGSTGKPKGAQLSHRNVMRLLAATREWFHFDHRDVWTLFHSYAFDFSVWEIFGALCYGGRLAIVPYRVSRAPEEFLALLRREQVTVLNQTPSAFKQLMLVPALYDATQPLALRLVIFGGEALDPRSLRPWMDHFGDLRPRLVNMYGITETTVHVTYRPIARDDLQSPRSPIGEQIPDLGMHVLDADLNPVPVGVPGELYVAGDGLARGYLHRAGLTAERFIADPSSRSGERLYRTGDLVRWNAERQLEYLGRVDHQVKIRGFRIELGEIEAQLLAQPDVREALVLAKEHEGTKRLLAYVVPNMAAFTDAPGASRSSRRELVTQWESVFDSTYDGEITAPSFRGWNSSYTDQPLPEVEMREWLARTVERIRELEPEQILEIGCGVGLLTQHLAPAARTYVGTDLSARAVKDLGAWIATQPALSHVRLRQGEATDFSDVATGAFDTVVLNSVAQYLPDADYLVDVIAGAVKAVGPNGHVFIGDVRHLKHVPMFHASVHLAKASAQTTVRQLRSRIARSVAQDKELVLDPDFFQALAGHLGIGHVRILLKRGRFANEMTHYRYDVVLHAERAELPVPTSLGGADVSALERVAAHLAANRPASVVLRGVPNGRLARDNAAWRLLQSCDERMTVAEVLARLKAEPLAGLDPETLWALGEKYGYEVRISWTRDSAEGAFDATFIEPSQLRMSTHLGVRREMPAHWRSLASDPVRALFLQQLSTQLRERLAATLPDYMVPAHFTLLESMPLNVNGKLDRKALPEPELSSSERFEAPDGEVERMLAATWSQVLGVERIGRHDNFFDVGGDSILSLQIVARARTAGWQVTPRQIFEHQTIAQLASVLEPVRSVSEVEPSASTVTQPATASRFDLVNLSQAELDALPIPMQQVEDLYPMTPLQRGMLFHSLQYPQSVAYADQLRVDVEGLDVARFMAAWQAVFDRHVILRTGFLSPDKQSLQWVARNVTFNCAQLDFREHSEATRALEELAKAELQQPFDFARPPLMRFILVRTGASRHHFIWTSHHVLTDGWSTAQLIGEVLRHYGEQPLAELRGQYRDYIRWLQRRDAQASERYWKTRLALLDEPTRLVEAPSSPPAGLGYKHSLELDAHTTKRIADFARRERVTLNTLVQAAWSVLLSRYTGQACVTFGAITSGRPAELPGVEQIIGPFINAFPVIVDVAPDRRIGDWLRDLQAQNIASREHEHTPLYEIQRWAGSAGRGLFDSLLVFENYPVDWTLREGTERHLRFSSDRYQNQTHYPVTLLVSHSDTLSLRFDSHEEVVARELMVTMAGHLQRLLEQIVVDQRRRVGEIQLLSQLEQQRLRQAAVNDAAHPMDVPIHQLVERQAERRPAAIALVFDGREISYRDLNARANRLAHRLIACGVRPEVRVGIALERSIEMVVGLLAIMKAGGAYVPLDPDYPGERLGYMLGDSGIEVLLTHSAVQSRLPSVASLTLALDDLDVGAEPDHNPSVAVHAESSIYVIYTSGTTGKPKGVINRHGALYNRLRWGQEHCPLAVDDVVLQKTPFSFDISFWEFFWPLTVGARLVLAGPGDHRDPARLAELIRRYGVTTIHFVPSMLQAFVAYEGEALCRTLRRIVCSGEALSIEAQTQVFVRFPWARLYNLYGPTEAAIEATHWLCKPHERGTVPIGRPVDGLRTFVLDAALNEVPAGAAGELYLGGVGLARGYLNRAGLSAERFIADPYSSGGERLYRTGDLVRWSSDGQLEYLGRIDHQVKIRGFRIELGEIETQLLAQAEITQAVVVAKSAPGGARLAGYVVPESGATIDTAVLRERLSLVLPDYMVPTVIVVLDRLPLNANGKLDRKALPEPAITHAAGGEPPVGEIETALAAIWAEVLQVERVGRHDNFFELGGHSLDAMKIVAAAEKMFGEDALSVAEVMQDPILQAQANHIRSPVHCDTHVARSDGPAAGVPLFCFPALHMNATQLGEIVAAVGGERTVYTFGCYSLSRSRWKMRSFEALAASYAEQVLNLSREGPVALLGWSVGGEIAFEVARQLRGKREVRFLGLLDVCVPEGLRRTASVRRHDSKAFEASVGDLLLQSRMRLQWSKLFSRMSDDEKALLLDYLQADHVALPLDGPSVGSSEFKLWLRLSHEAMMRRYEWRRNDVPAHVWLAEATVESGLHEVRDWRELVQVRQARVIERSDHSSLPRHAELLRELEACLRRVDQELEVCAASS